MSIASEITRINNNISSAYSALAELGATIPSAADSAHLAATVGTISGQSGVPVNKYTWDQMKPKVGQYLAAVDYTGKDSSVSYIAGYVIAAQQDPEHNPSPHRPVGTAIAIPSAGTLTIQDGAGAISAAVTAGSYTAYNITPGKAGTYTLRNANNEVVAAGTLVPDATYTPSGSQTAKGALRMIYLNDASNVRDLGGWSCDGGKVKYGKLFRGTRLFCDYNDNHRNDIDPYDVAVLHDLLGIRHELDLRWATDAAPAPAELARGYSLIGRDVAWTHIDGVNYDKNSFISDPNTSKHTVTMANIKAMVELVFDCAINGTPLYFHCAAGADRTGTLALIIEALLGLSQSDMDKDYELTSFYSGVSTPELKRGRDEEDWQGLVAAFDGYQEVGETLTLQQKIVRCLIPLGISIERINAFRHAMIDGTPTDIVNPYPDITVTTSLTDCTIDNTTAQMYSPFSATLTADSGHTLVGASVTVTMGGTDITSTAYSNGVISIAQVTGAVSITASAPADRQNLFDPATSTYNSRINSSYQPATAGSANGGLVVNLITITSGMSKLNISGVTQVRGSSASQTYYLYVVAFDANGTKVSNVKYESSPTYQYDVAALLNAHSDAVSVRLGFFIKDGTAISTADTADLVVYAT